MNTDFFELVGLGAVPEIAEAVSARPELASSRNSEGVSALLWAVYCGQEPARRFLRTGLAAAGVDLDIFEAAATGDGERCGQSSKPHQMPPALSPATGGLHSTWRRRLELRKRLPFCWPAAPAWMQ